MSTYKRQLRILFAASLALAVGAPVLFGGANASAGTLTGILETTPGSLGQGPFQGDSGLGTAPPNDVEITGTGLLTPDPTDIWNKNIWWDYSNSDLSPGDVLCVHEQITLFNAPGSSSQPLKVTDWHETILGGNLQWEMGTAAISARVGASPISLDANIEVSPDGKEIWFAFPPLMPSAIDAAIQVPVTLDIIKYVVYTGPVLTSGGSAAILPFEIHEQPSVPEPGTAGLATLALVGVWLVRQRR